MIFLNVIESIIVNPAFVLVTILVSFLLKLLIILFTINQSINARIAQRLRLLLLAILIANMSSDIAWILFLLQKMSIFTIDPHIKKFVARIAWGLVGMQYQGLALFLEGLATRKFLSTIRQKICCTITTLIMLVPIGAAFICFNHPAPHPLIFTVERIGMIYYTLFLLPFSLLIVIRKLHLEPLPYILGKQLRIFIYALIIPHLVSEIIHTFPIYFTSYIPGWELHNYAIIPFSALFLSIGLFYCARKVMGLRFLNLRDHVQAPPKVTFITNFKTILDQLGQVVNTRELGLITQNFFKEAFGIPLKKTKLYLRPVETPYQQHDLHSSTNAIAEKFISTSKQATNDVIVKLRTA